MNSTSDLNLMLQLALSPILFFKKSIQKIGELEPFGILRSKPHRASAGYPLPQCVRAEFSKPPAILGASCQCLRSKTCIKAAHPGDFVQISSTNFEDEISNDEKDLLPQHLRYV